MKTATPILKRICILIGIFFCISCLRSSDKSTIVLSNTQITNTTSDKVKVEIDQMKFIPDTIIIKKSTTVMWVNKQTIIPHSVTSDTKGLFDSGDMHKSDTFLYTFSKEGTYQYHCSHHNKMHGVVIVK